jgi:NAD-dependent deacetylase
MSDSGLAGKIARVRGWIEDSNAISVLTGAGISTESGIPDFRGPKGLWTLNPEAEKQANLQYYLSDREVRRRSWQMRLDPDAGMGGLWNAKPNAGHRALARLEQRGKLHTLVTQNVDGLHQAAGNSPARVVEIHGSMREFMCMSCDDRGPIERVLERVRAGDADPRCRSCGGILKTRAVSFGQNLFPGDMERAEAGALGCDLMLAIGTTLAVYPAAGVVPAAKQNGARVVILNSDPTEMDFLADELLRGSIGEILPQLVG